MTTVNGIDFRAVIVDALRQRGSTPDTARRFVQEFRDLVAAGAVADSDHAAYRVLADAVSAVLRTEVFDNDMRPDATAEPDILITLVTWLPDLVRHRDAEKIRAEYDVKPNVWSPASGIADLVDPFIRNSGGQWIRKDNNVPVPWPVVTD